MSGTRRLWVLVRPYKLWDEFHASLLENLKVFFVFHSLITRCENGCKSGLLFLARSPADRCGFKFMRRSTRHVILWCRTGAGAVPVQVSVLWKVVLSNHFLTSSGSRVAVCLVQNECWEGFIFPHRSWWRRMIEMHGWRWMLLLHAWARQGVASVGPERFCLFLFLAILAY